MRERVVRVGGGGECGERVRFLKSESGVRVSKSGVRESGV